LNQLLCLSMFNAVSGWVIQVLKVNECRSGLLGAKAQDCNDDHSPNYNDINRVEFTTGQTVDDEHEYSKDQRAKPKHSLLYPRQSRSYLQTGAGCIYELQFGVKFADARSLVTIDDHCL
jgi:hypothetical protein